MGLSSISEGIRCMWAAYAETSCRTFVLTFSGWQHAVDLENERVKIIAYRATVTADSEPKIEASESENNVQCQNVQKLPYGSTVWWCYVHKEVENLQSRDICLDFVAIEPILI